MGVDLKLLPLLEQDYWAAHDVIRLDRSYELWTACSELPQRQIKEPISCYFAKDLDGESCYGKIHTTPYGEDLTWVTAGDMVSLKSLAYVRDNWRNRAAWSYLAEMPADWKIVLYWC